MEKNIKQIARTISKLSAPEIDMLTSALLEHNISATIYHFGGISTEVNTTATVFLRNAGNRKLMLLKTVKEYLGIGLREAKDIIDSAPCVVIEDTSIENAEALREALEECGATIEIH